MFLYEAHKHIEVAEEDTLLQNGAPDWGQWLLALNLLLIVLNCEHWWEALILDWPQVQRRVHLFVISGRWFWSAARLLTQHLWDVKVVWIIWGVSDAKRPGTTLLPPHFDLVAALSFYHVGITSAATSACCCVLLIAFSSLALLAVRMTSMLTLIFRRLLTPSIH